MAVVVGGYNSSNTNHLVELLEEKFSTFYIKNKEEILSKSAINSFDIHTSKVLNKTSFIPEKENIRIIITSGASCPDALVDGVLHKIISLVDSTIELSSLLNTIE